MDQSDVTRDDLLVENVVSSSGQRLAVASNNVLAIIGTIASQAVLITGFLYYFGWVYAHSFLGYFGVDSSLVDYSTVDYTLRSINVMFEPFIYLTFATFVLFNFHRLIVVPMLIRVVRDPSPLSNTVDSAVRTGRSTTLHYARPRISRVVVSVVGWARVSAGRRLGLAGARWIINTIQTVAIILSATVIIGLLFPEQVGVPLRLLLPIFLLLAVSLLGYIEHLRARYAEALSAVKIPWPTPSSWIYIPALLMVGVVAGLWITSQYAEYVGTQLATEVVAGLPVRPGITVYSTERIALSGNGVVVKEITGPDVKYRYQYIGLRLLVRSGDKFLLLPSKWQRGRDRVFFLRDDNSVRIDAAVR
ncbi:MAG: hypothetical protein ACREP9_17360 [Candidatus Dormibacteraceae bacterium]